MKLATPIYGDGRHRIPVTTPVSITDSIDVARGEPEGRERAHDSGERPVHRPEAPPTAVSGSSRPAVRERDASVRSPEGNTPMDLS